jgi:hypothetical protein
MARVTVPDGCRRLDMEDGTRYRAGAGGHVEVSSEHEAALRRGWYGQSGVISGQSFTLGTKTGRWCGACRRAWQAWSTTCPRCHGETVPE